MNIGRIWMVGLECSPVMSYCMQHVVIRDTVPAGARLDVHGLDGTFIGVIRLGTVVLGAIDVGRAVSFWSDVLGYEPVEFVDADDGFTILIPPTGEGTRVAVHRSNTSAQDHPRVHLDLIVDSGIEQAAEIERLVGLGASRVSWDYPRDPDFVVLCDTEGNRFCVVDTSQGG
jgi:catechol 2,3-dioxygenase-like lactoylglutathione lyase family enzyme